MTTGIRERGAGTFEIKYYVTDPATGRRVARYASFRGAKRQAQAKRSELIVAAANGGIVDRSKETLGEFLIRWDRDWCAHNVGPKTRERWQQLAAIQVTARIGGMPIQRIEPSHLISLYATLLREGGAAGGPLAPRTVGHVHRMLRRAFGHALTWKTIREDPSARVSPPKVEEVEVAIPSEDEVAAILDHMRDRDPQLHAIAVTALSTGARLGELCALAWSAFDETAGTLKIARSLESTKAGLRFKTPKTRSGKRTIGVSAWAVETLRAQWKRQQEQRLALGMGRASPDDLIFAKFDGAPLEPDTLSKAWLRLTAAATGRSIGLHALRHHHASSLIAAGVDILAISRRLGHASPTITLSVYGHLYPNIDDRAVQATDAMFARVRTKRLTSGD